MMTSKVRFQISYPTSNAVWVDRWAEKFLPGEGTPMEPSESGFPDDDDWEEGIREVRIQPLITDGIDSDNIFFPAAGHFPAKGEVPCFFNGANL